MSREVLEYNRLLKPICGLLTNHRHSKLIGWEVDFVKRNYKYPNRSDFYYKCKVCGYVYFNNHVSKEDLEKIKKLESKDE